MKQIFTLFLCSFLLNNLQAQLVLNEIYTDPGAGKHEFFELYNPELLAEEANDYTIVTFYNANNKKGFYVLDLPFSTVQAKRFFVGSSAKPFNYQGVSGSNKSTINWNDLTLMSANGGRLSKWEYNPNDNGAATDNNPYYDYSAPTNVNDFFSRLSGSGSSYVVLLYKKGLIVNSAIFGAGGTASLSTDITTMPPLYIDMAGGSPDFTIHFSTYGGLPVEDVNQDAGTDNGYTRKSNGACGSWTKSSSQNTHSPLASNGQEIVNARGSITVEATIKTGNPVGGSQLTYFVSSATANVLPAQLYIYVDNGNMLAQLDEYDKLIAIKSVSQVGARDSLIFLPYDHNIIIVTKSPTGCVDNTKLIANVVMTPLNVRFTNFFVSKKGTLVDVNWQVQNNAEASAFELERSVDGYNFITLKAVKATAQKEIESYFITTPDHSIGDVYYRIKSIGQNNAYSYSEVVKSTSRGKEAGRLQLLGNPVYSTLSFLVLSDVNTRCAVNVYSVTGIKVYSFNPQLTKGQNRVQLELEGKFGKGLYLLECVMNGQRSTVKFSYE